MRGEAGSTVRLALARPARAPLALAPLALALCLAGCDDPPTEPPKAAGALRGVTFVSWSADGYAAPEASESLLGLAQTGANTVVILVTAYQSDVDASVVRADDPRTPTVASVSAAVTQAKQLGLRVALKLHVDVDDGSWRALIDPAQPEDWFRSYQEFALSWAAFTESEGLDLFLFGTELAGTLQYEALWDETIRALRATYSGPLCYSASWDEAELVPFWDRVEYVGVNAYYPVALTPHPSRFDLLAGWQPWLARLAQLHERTGRPLLLTELGYRSVDGAGMDPHDFASTPAIDLGEQADLYWAALEATGEEPWIHGICWWNWPADGTGGPSDGSYSPNGKPAAEVLASAW